MSTQPTQSAADLQRQVDELRRHVGTLETKLREAERTPTRRRLPATRQSVTHKFSVSGHEGYISVGLYEDGQPAEVFLRVAKEGSTVAGLMAS